MPAIPLPDRPNVEQLRKQAKDLQRAEGIPLHAAQLSLARRHGFPSWARLVAHVELRVQLTRAPADADAAAAADPEREDPVDRFLRLACLTYEDDEPGRWDEARRVLAEHPDLAEHSVHAAAACADVDALGRHLGADPRRASEAGGPHRWVPLMYLAYARHDPDVTEAAVVGAARRILDAGADPNAGYLWHGLPTPFTVLTGAFGEGEGGPERQPRHVRSQALARVLLEAGADPNDGQALYNRMFQPDDSHLELLFEWDLGTGDGGVWKARLGDALDPPSEMLRAQLRWALTHGMAARVRLLAEHGVDVATPFADGRTPSDVAALSGHPELLDLLAEHGAVDPDLSPTAQLLAAVLAGDRVTAEALVAADPEATVRARAARPGLVVWAATLDRPAAVDLALELGFDVNALGRTDVPRGDRWETALHHAAGTGDLALARRLLASGADPTVEDARFHSTPLGWAEHFGQEAMVELLSSVANEDHSSA